MTTYVTPRLVPHSSVQPDCTDCGYNRGNCGDGCSACKCRWMGQATPAPDWCEDGYCACHDLEARECGNCSSVVTDWRPVEFARSDTWVLCSVCIDKMRVAS